MLGCLILILLKVPLAKEAAFLARVRRRIRGSSEQGRQDRLLRVKDCH